VSSTVTPGQPTPSGRSLDDAPVRPTDATPAQGIPVVMETRPGETRVHAGPFASRAEAEHVRAKLEAAGMGKGMLVILRH